MIQFIGSRKHGSAMPHQIVAFEKLVGAELPADYQQFLKEHNGGRPQPDAFEFDGGEEDAVECFFPLRDLASDESLELTDADWLDWPLQRAWETFQTNLQEDCAECDLDNQGFQLDRLLPIGTDGCGNSLCLVLDGDDLGCVVFFDHETAGVTPLADSFSEFLAMLHEPRSHSDS